MDTHSLVRETIYRSTILLDAQDWNGWLAHCDPAFQYAIRAWSPEINKDLTYNAAAGQEDLAINIPLISYHNFTFNGVTNSDLRLRFPKGHRGTINFDGAGNEVEISENEGIGGTLKRTSQEKDLDPGRGGGEQTERGVRDVCRANHAARPQALADGARDELEDGEGHQVGRDGCGYGGL